MRSRNLKPGFFKNEELAEIDAIGRLLFAGLWCMADREGRLEDRIKKIKAEILPYDNCSINELLNILHEKGFIIRYSIDHKEYIQICNFQKHQNPHIKETASELPAPPGHQDSGIIPYYVPPELREEIYRRDGYKCKNCDAETKLTIDHIIPRSRGGPNDKDNLQTLCNTCNSGKGNDNRKLRKQKSAGKSGTSTGKSGTGREMHRTSPADSLNLIPDSLNLDISSTDSPPDGGPVSLKISGVATIWNNAAPCYLPRVKLPFDPKRARKLTRHLDGTLPIEYWESLFREIDLSDFYSGKNGKWKSMDFDWAVINHEKLRRKLDGEKLKRPAPQEEQPWYAKN